MQIISPVIHVKVRYGFLVRLYGTIRTVPTNIFLQKKKKMPKKIIKPNGDLYY
jgi:hypothetical protein